MRLPNFWSLLFKGSDRLSIGCYPDTTLNHIMFTEIPISIEINTAYFKAYSPECPYIPVIGFDLNRKLTSDFNSIWPSAYAKLYKITRIYEIAETMQPLINALIHDYYNNRPNRNEILIWSLMALVNMLTRILYRKKIMSLDKKFTIPYIIHDLILLIHHKPELYYNNELQECYVCYDAIGTCTTCGHYICRNCYIQLDTCGYCRSEFPSRFKLDYPKDYTEGEYIMDLCWDMILNHTKYRS